jgi:hypothetical protein
MASTPYSLSGLAAIYKDAYLHGEPTLAFEVQQGKGRFVFLMFFSEEDTESRDRLFLYLRTTTKLLEFKLYGSHARGGSSVYVNDHQERAIRAELQLEGGSSPFELKNFFSQLNAGIPQSLSLQSTLEKVRAVWPQVRTGLSHVLDDAEKTILIGVRRLPGTHKPREKTLRKLYMYTSGSAREVESLIAALRAANITLIWSNEEGAKGKTFADIMGDVAQTAGR